MYGRWQVKNSRRFLFTTSPMRGHFHPLVPVARALLEAGHEVAFASTERFRPAVEAAGLTFFCAGFDRDQDPEFGRLMARAATMPPGPESERELMTEVFLSLGPRRMAEDLLPIAERWKPDMLLREAAEFGAVMVAERLGLPYADVEPGAWIKAESIWLEDAARYLDPVRQDLGLPPDPQLASLHRYLMLAPAPPSYALADLGVPRDYPATTHFIRPHFYDGGDRAVLPAWVFDLPKQPTVYVTMGTEVPNMPGGGYFPAVYRTILEGLAGEPLNVIVTVSREQDPAALGPQPPNVHVEHYIPQSLLLPHCDLVISHGGSNTLLQTLDTGLPMVIIPAIADQFFNAALYRMMQLGPAIDLPQLTPEAVREAARDVLRNAVYRKNIDCLRAEMHVLPGLDHAVRLVEQIVSRRQPAAAVKVAELEKAC